MQCPFHIVHDPFSKHNTASVLIIVDFCGSDRTRCDIHNEVVLDLTRWSTCRARSGVQIFNNRRHKTLLTVRRLILLVKINADKVNTKLLTTSIFVWGCSHVDTAVAGRDASCRRCHVTIF